MRHGLVVLVLLLVVVVVCSSPVWADSVPGEPQTVEDLKKQVADLEVTLAGLRAETEHYRFLRDEAQAFREFVQSERDSLTTFTERVFWVAGIAIGLLAALFVGFEIKNVRDVTRRVADEIRSSASEHMNAVATEAVGGLKSRVNLIDSMLTNETFYRRAQVVAAGRNEPLKDLVRDASSIFRASGPEPYMIALPDGWDELRTRLAKRQVHAVVYAFQANGGQDEDLDRMVHLLMEAAPSTPLVIYHPGSGRIDGENGRVVKDYKLATFANSAITVVTNLYPLLRLFGGRFDG